MLSFDTSLSCLYAASTLPRGKHHKWKTQRRKYVTQPALIVNLRQRWHRDDGDFSGNLKQILFASDHVQNSENIDQEYHMKRLV